METIGSIAPETPQNIHGIGSGSPWEANEILDYSDAHPELSPQNPGNWTLDGDTGPVHDAQPIYALKLLPQTRNRETLRIGEDGKL